MTETQLWLAAERIAEQADSEQHARMAMAYLLDSLGGSSNLALLESIDRRREALLEAASKERKPGDKWPSESNPNRWFWKNPQTGRVTPYKPTEEEKAKAKNTPNNSASIRQSPPDNTATAAKPKATPAAKPAPKAAAPKKTAAPKQPTATLDDVKAQLTAMQQGQGDPEGLMGALLGLGLADIRKLRDEYKGAGGGRSKNDVAQRIIDKVKADIVAERQRAESDRMRQTQDRKERDADAELMNRPLTAQQYDSQFASPFGEEEKEAKRQADRNLQWTARDLAQRHRQRQKDRGESPTLPKIVPSGHKVTSDTIRTLWDHFPGAKDNLVSLADLKDSLGVDTKTLHNLVNELRRRGRMSAQNIENREGTQAEKDRLRAAGIPDGQNTIGYVSLHSPEWSR